jgi:phosphatidylserine/phosphatidylglycerophosphate/cardiolipin synthase-like enzyme
MKNLLTIFLYLVCILLPTCTLISAQNTITTSTSPLQITTQTIPQNTFDRLITEPEDSIAPVLQMIQEAEKSIDLVMYEMEDTRIENALISAEKNGVAVRVLLNEGKYGAQPSSYSAAAYQYLQSGGISVRWAPSYFALTHQKTICGRQPDPHHDV